jgi:hypothetical protein
MLAACPESVAALAGTWYLDRKGELPPGKLPFFVMPVVQFHKVNLLKKFGRLLL